MANLDQQRLLRGIIQNQAQPNEGPIAFATLLDFSGTVSEWDIDFTEIQQRAFISMIQTLFLDLSNSANPLTVTISGAGQAITAKAHTQGYYNILCPNPPRFAFTSAAGGVIIPVQFINVAIPGVVWPTV